MKDQLQTVVQRISERLAKLLIRQVLLTQEDDSNYLTLDTLDTTPCIICKATV